MRSLTHLVVDVLELPYVVHVSEAMHKVLKDGGIQEC